MLQKYGSRITGIGGIFFKAADPDKLKDWYKTQLHFDLSPWGGRTFMRRDAENPDEIGRTEWSIMDEKTDYRNPSTKKFLLSYRAAELEKLNETLKAKVLRWWVKWKVIRLANLAGY